MAKPAVGMTDGELADAWGEAKKREGRVEARIEEIKAEFERRKLGFAKGVCWMVFKDVSTQNRTDMDAVREKFGADALKPFVKESTRTSYRVKPVEAA